MAPTRPLQPQAKLQKRDGQQAARRKTQRRVSGKSMFWRQLIHKMLKTPKGQPCHNYWKASDHMPQTRSMYFHHYAPVLGTVIQIRYHN